MTPNTPLVSNEIIRAAQAGDREASEQVFAAYRTYVRGICLRMTANTFDADDLTQEALLQLFRKLKGFRFEAAFKTWLHRVTVNTVLMKMRKRKQEAAMVPLDARSFYEGEESAPTNEKALQFDPRTLEKSSAKKILGELLGKVPDDARRILILKGFADLNGCEIATILGCSITSQKSRLHRAKKSRKRLVLPHATNLRGTVEPSSSHFSYLTPIPIAHAASCNGYFFIS
jgi:RNA polymerase sigma-70 factor, ECF subfamily